MEGINIIIDAVMTNLLGAWLSGRPSLVFSARSIRRQQPVAGHSPEADSSDNGMTIGSDYRCGGGRCVELLSRSESEFAR